MQELTCTSGLPPAASCAAAWTSPVLGVKSLTCNVISSSPHRTGQRHWKVACKEKHANNRGGYRPLRWCLEEGKMFKMVLK
jgi:hypothetical protein